MSDIPTVKIIQSVAILIDGNNIERSLHSLTKDDNCMINFDNLIPKLLKGRGLSRLIYFREGNQISSKLADRLLTNYMGSVVPCHKSADIPLSISATQIARKVDTIIILSGDSDYVELVRHLKGEGVRIEIAAVKATTAQILIDESDHFIEINEEDSFSLVPKRGSSKRPSAKTRTSSHRSTSKASPAKESKTPSKKNTAAKSNDKVSTPTTSKSKPNSKSTKKESTETVKAKKETAKPTKSKKAAPKRGAKKPNTAKQKEEITKSSPKSKRSNSNSKSKAAKGSTNSNTSKKRNPPRPKKSRGSGKDKAMKIEPIDDFSY